LPIDGSLHFSAFDHPHGVTGVTIGRGQAQPALAATPDRAKSARNRRHRPDARKEAGL